MATLPSFGTDRVIQWKSQVQHVEDVTLEEAKKFPSFKDLPLGKDDPPYSAWGLWGKDDEVGTIVSLYSICHFYLSFVSNSPFRDC